MQRHDSDRCLVCRRYYHQKTYRIVNHLGDCFPDRGVRRHGFSRSKRSLRASKLLVLQREEPDPAADPKESVADFLFSAQRLCERLIRRKSDFWSF
jgi:hypothetical protein